MRDVNSTRIIGLDLARLVALLGMFIAHLVPAQGDGPGGVSTLFQVVAGRSAALFAVLAGVSIALVTRDRTLPLSTHRSRLVTRALLIAAIGMVLGMFDSGIAVILTYYGLLFVLALPVLAWSPRALAWLALGWGLLSPVVSLALRSALPGSTYQVPSPMSLAHPLQLASELLVTGYYPVLTWATYLFAGMAIGRLDLRSARVRRWLVLLGVWLAVLALAISRWVTRSEQVRTELGDSLAGSPGWSQQAWAGLSFEALDMQLRRGFYGTHPTGSGWWLGVWVPHSGSIVDLAHTLGTSLFFLGLCLIIVHWTAVLPWRVLSGAGAMTLTLYSAHIVTLALNMRILWVHVVASLVVGAGFAWAGRRGPLESLVRAISQGTPESRITR